VGQATDSLYSFRFEGVYSALPWYNSKGGLQTDIVYMDNLDLTAKVNFEKLFKIKDPLSLYVYAIWNNGQRATDLMGDAQVASNIESIRSGRIFELWLQKNLLRDKVSILFGLYDLNSEFDVIRPGTMFINSSFGIGAEYAQSGKNGPSIFPVTSLSLRLATFIGSRTRIKLAVLDAVPGDPLKPKRNTIKLSKEDGALIATEISFYTNKTVSEKKSKIDRQYETRRRKVGREYNVYRNDRINIGSWHYTNKFPVIDDSLSLENGNFGVYAGFQKYFSLNRNGDDITLFARVGLANSKFNRFSSAISGGIVSSNPLTKFRDRLGIAVSSAINGPQFLEIRDGMAKAETVIELTYALPLFSRLLIQPDIQYVFYPSTRKDLDNPLSFAMLIQFSVGP